MFEAITSFVSGVLQLNIIPYLFVPVFLYFLSLIIIRIIRF